MLKPLQISRPSGLGLILILSSLLLFGMIACQWPKKRVDTAQYLIVNHSSDEIWIYFRHSFPPEKYKENMIVVEPGQTGVCSQFTDSYVKKYLSTFNCGLFADSISIYKVHTPDTSHTPIIQQALWTSNAYQTDEFYVHTCTYTITDQDF